MEIVIYQLIEYSDIYLTESLYINYFLSYCKIIINLFV